MVIFKEYVVDDDGCIYRISYEGDAQVEIEYYEAEDRAKTTRRLAFSAASAEEVAKCLLMAAADYKKLQEEHP